MVVSCVARFFAFVRCERMNATRHALSGVLVSSTRSRLVGRPCFNIARFSCSSAQCETPQITQRNIASTAEYLSCFSPSQPIEVARTPASNWYHRPDFLDIEKKFVFLKSWQPVGRVDQVNEIGQYFTGSLLGEPYIVVRDDKNEIRAYYNVCRHHAAKIVDGCGKAEELKCPYHGWTYALDGRLKKATRVKGMKEFSPRENGLLPIDVCVWGPFVWINMARSVDKEAKVLDLHEELGKLKLQLEPTEWEKLKFVKRVEYPLNCNWKVYVENYCDGGYHVSHLHPNLGNMLDLNTYKTDIHNIYSVQYADTTKDPNAGKSGVDFVERVGSSVVYAFIYPNFMINRYGKIMDTNYVIPLTNNTCKVVFDYFFLETEGEKAQEFIKNSLVASDKVQEEDTTICEDVQKGVGTIAYDKNRGRYAPEVETPMYHFHCLLSKSVSNEL
eukprot:Phypoly_transcript_06808.p1 GENE.Phypoly_transcript_06808~~Phypoly_transcript_06808.p1  ORF type:complete len:443 (+),score=61.73 Phypoly_transcript_06808:311-1639(+)